LCHVIDKINFIFEATFTVFEISITINLFHFVCEKGLKYWSHGIEEIIKIKNFTQ
jgi:hypothetical protein